MKHLFLSLLATCALIHSAHAQAPRSFNYQAALRNSSGTIMAAAPVTLRFSIRDLAATGTLLYQETASTTTSTQGIVNAQVGGGTVLAGSMSSINWGEGAKFLQVEVDAGTGFVDMGAQQLISVPYSLYTNGVQATSSGGAGLTGSTTSSLWWGFYEAGLYRGYLGSYSGKNEDVDFGTGGGNTTGSVHLCVAANPKLTVDSIGNVGIGTRFPKYRFQVDGITGSFFDNGLRINNVTASSGWSFYSSSSGALIIGRSGNLGSFDGTSGVYTAISDERLKSNIRPLEPVLGRVLQINTKRYEFIHNNPDHKQSIGIIAQELQRNFPEYVYEHKAGDGQPFVQQQLGVDYAGLSILSIKAIQEQQVLIQQLIDKNKELEAAIAELKK